MAHRAASRLRDFPAFVTLILSTALFLLLGAGPASSAPPAPSRTVKSVGVVQNNATTTVSIRGDEALEYEYFFIEGTNQLVIDIYDAVNGAWPTIRKVGGPLLKQIKIGEHFEPRQMVRVQLELQKAGDFRVRDEGSQITVSLGKPPAAPAPPPEKPPVYNTILGLTFVPMAGKSRIEIKTVSKPKYEVMESDNPLQVIVDINGAVMSPRAETTIDISDLERELNRVNTIQDRKGNTPYVRFIAHLGQAVPSRVTPGSGGLTIDIDHVSPASPTWDAATAPAAAKPDMKVQAAHPGKKISLDFVNADVNDMLRIIAPVAGVNFAAGDEVKGKVSIRLLDVPWEVALDTILMTNNPKLAQVPISENIIRITTRSALLNEEGERQKVQDLKRKKLEAERKMEEAARELEPLVTREFSISYANITDLEKVVNKIASNRVDEDGFLTSDSRTNTIIVKDLRANAEEMGRIIRKLDTPTPAVVVEARIVEVTSDFSKELGVQWNVDFNADPSHGNALPFTFPNSIGLGGGVQGENPGGDTSPYMVSLPASAPTAGIGFSFGHIANTLSLDLRLTAAQGMNKVKILSTPRILVVQNVEAKMNVGQELPIPSTDAEGNREVEWREVGISLVVTPQVTNDKRVFMEIKVAKESQGPPVSTTDGIMFSIISRKAETQVLIGDGETAVIGGLAIEGVSEQEDSVPALSKIPGLGWLFQHSADNTQRDELMIFLTPKIVASY